MFVFVCKKGNSHLPSRAFEFPYHNLTYVSFQYVSCLHLTRDDGVMYVCSVTAAFVVNEIRSRLQAQAGLKIKICLFVGTNFCIWFAKVSDLLRTDFPFS